MMQEDRSKVQFVLDKVTRLQAVLHEIEFPISNDENHAAGDDHQ
jgi:hypothetical protein